MKIEWLGINCVRITTKQLDQDVVTVIEPYSQEKTGLHLPRNIKESSILIQPAETEIPPLSPESCLINSSGEYEIRGVYIHGIPCEEKKEGKISRRAFIPRIEAEQISFAHLGSVKEILDNGTLEKLQGVDILFLPVGGYDTLSHKKAAEIVRQIEPRIVIPINFYLPELKKIPLEKVDNFCKEMGKKCDNGENFLRIAKKDLPQEEMNVVVLNRV